MRRRTLRPCPRTIVLGDHSRDGSRAARGTRRAVEAAPAGVRCWGFAGDAGARVRLRPRTRRGREAGGLLMEGAPGRWGLVVVLDAVLRRRGG
ncbi:MAG: hypothetical protein AAFQ51_11720, partial [Pseudomonadota bacterium]